MIIACHHVNKAFLEVPILKDITFHLEKGDKTALVGINGAGKTTLLRILTGSLQPDSGEVTVPRDLPVGYLAQDQGLSSDSTIYEEMRKTKLPLIQMEEKIRGIEAEMAQVSGAQLSGLMEEYHSLLSAFDALGGYTYKSEIPGVLKGLGFSEEDFNAGIATLSGGQKTRVALAKILLQNPALIILDEPTNHLDIASIRWLENYIRGYRGTVLIVSHDRFFLDRTVTSVLELENGRMTVFRGNYTDYAERKKALRIEQQRAYLNNRAMIRHQEEVIAKLRSFNREKSIRRAESREKLLAKAQVIEKPAEIRDDMHLSFSPVLTGGRDVLHVERFSKSFGEKHLFSGVSFDVRRGEHIAVIGSNGTGKTTLLKILNGIETADDGIYRTGTDILIAYYDQEYHVLHDEKTVFEEIADEFPQMTNTQVRSLLAAFLFTGDDVFRRISEISGGEKGRISLAKLMLSGANLLFLDEPTNHLDIVSREILENALNAYTGTVIYVSHDRYFVNRTASRILELKDGRLTDYGPPATDEVPDMYIGNYDSYLLHLAEEENAEQTGRPSAGAGPAQAQSAADWKAQKQAQSDKRRILTAIARCEEKISVLESDLRALEEKMQLPENAADPAALRELSKEMEIKNSELSAAMEDWEKLAASVDDSDGD